MPKFANEENREMEVVESAGAPMPAPDSPPADSSVLASPDVEARPAGEYQSTGEPSVAPVPGENAENPEPSVNVEVGDGDNVPDEATGEPAVADEELLDENREDAREAEAEGDVLFADSGLSVHVKLSDSPAGKDMFSGEDLYDVRGVVLAPGDTVPVSDLPPYLQRALENGEVAGARKVSARKARELNEEAARVRELASQSVGVESDMVTEVA